MKTSVAITLIVCGTVLIVVPHIYSVIQTALVARTMAELSKEVSFGTGVQKNFNIFCVLIGVVMILAGAMSTALKSKLS